MNLEIAVITALIFVAMIIYSIALRHVFKILGGIFDMMTKFMDLENDQDIINKKIVTVLDNQNGTMQDLTARIEILEKKAEEKNDEC